VAAGWLAGATGCAKLEVKKIPIENRIEGHDHVDGFRYYLSRPYVVVKNPVPVSTQQALVTVVEPAPRAGSAAGADRATTIRFLDGPHAGQAVRLHDLAVTSPGSPGLRRLSDAEVAALEHAVRDEAVQRAQAPAAAGSDQSGASDALTANTESLQAAPFATFSAFDPTKPRGRSIGTLAGDIDVVFLPDLDEQYAVQSKNFLSKSTFGLVFKNGWELTDVSAEHDSTPVAIELLNTISKAVDAAKTIAGAGLGAPAAVPGVAADVAAETRATTGRPGETVRLYYLTLTTYLKPGLYRINKPWEVEGRASPPVGCGLLAQLGLTTVTEVQLNLLTKSPTR
jgi:hypothetical protein